MINLAGRRVVVSSACMTHQRVKISDGFQWITTEARERINGELLAMFGADDDTYIVGDVVYITQRVVNALKGMRGADT